MKKVLFICSVLITLSVHAQDAYRFKLLGNWNNPNLSTNPNMPGQIWSDLVGWVDSATGKEYIIMGSIDSIYFFDVSDPAHIKLCDVEWGLNRATNRDMDWYQHYVYCVSDNAGPGKLQIFDLQYLPDSVHKVYESDTLGHNTHSIFINRESKRLYMSLNKVAPSVTHAMDIASLEKPDSPAFLGGLYDPFGCQRVHEAYIKHDTAFCSCEYNGLYVFDVRDPQNIQPLGAITPPYPYNGYNHTSWTDSLNEFIAFTDEVPSGLPAKIYRIRELNDMTYETHFNTHEGATPHNVIWIGNKLYFSWYHDGVYIFSVDTPRTPRVYAFYDTYPQNQPGSYSGYAGCWGIYPFLPSGNIAASDMSNGLFMLRYDETVGVRENEQPIRKFSVYPNPFYSSVTLHFINAASSLSTCSVFDLQGRLLLSKQVYLPDGENDVKLEEVSALKPGPYFITISNEQGTLRQTIVKD